MISMGKEKKLWIELCIRSERSVEDVLADFLVSELGRGVVIEDVPGNEELVRIKAYLSREDLESGALRAIETYIEELAAIHPDIQITFEEEKIIEEDWHDKWKEYFKPLRIGRRIVVKPTWEQYVPQVDEVVIEIDPGRVFGVGSHPSTRLILEKLEELAGQGLLDSASVLDVGTGSGILAICAAKLGAKNVIAVDNDPDAVEIARANASLNHVHDRIYVSTTPVWNVEGPFDIVLANIDRDTLLVLSKDISKQVARRGRLILSGILDDQAAAVSEAYCSLGLKMMCKRPDRKDSRWVLLEFQNSSGLICPSF